MIYNRASMITAPRVCRAGVPDGEIMHEPKPTHRSPDDAIRFLLGGRQVAVTGVEPTCSVLRWLREQAGRTGTKEGCAEGDCGACTVVVGELVEGGLRLKAVNACIQLLPTLDGKALFTVEDLRRGDGALHPVQQAMVDCHGSQCGFCTPGFVMSLWSVYLDAEERSRRPADADLRTAISGNLCRCTGYRPILEAGARMFDLPAVALDRGALTQAMTEIAREEGFHYRDATGDFHAPKTLGELVSMRAAHPDATIVAGCTDVGLWVNKAFRELGTVIYVGDVRELHAIQREGDMLRVGAAVTLEDAYRALASHYPQVTEMWERFASVPIRNAGTLGGNVANGSPIGDSMPWLIAVGASVVVRSAAGARSVALDDFYLAYMKNDLRPDEIVEAIDIPLPVDGLAFRTYKVSKRYDSDISAVCAAFALKLESGRIAGARIAYGGMAAVPRRARSAETALAGRPWDESAAHAAMAALASDFTPLSDMRASSAYRLETAQNLLWRFHLETRPANALPAAALSVFEAERAARQGRAASIAEEAR
ncbi:MAG TPA: xanthine dehydrogenase small subunit [Casimicrobiaceae bacterium]|nr:xanthine dehydrogenase small subunit [Casimicrobiaceae bacterium]